MSNESAITIVAAILAVGLVLYISRLVGKVAERRGRNFYIWAALAFVLPIPAIILIYILPNKAPPNFGAAVRHF